MEEIMEKPVPETENAVKTDQAGNTDHAEQKTAAPSGLKKKKNKKNRKRLIAIVLIIAIILGLWLLLGKKKGNGKQEVMTDFVQIGSITAVVDGSGLATAKQSEALTLTTPGTVMDVFVTEGQMVEAGEPLFTIDSPEAARKVQEARSNLEGAEKELSNAYKKSEGLNLSVPYSGKLIETKHFEPGDTIGEEKVATLIDDTKMRLTQYYSYAYAGEIKAGQKVSVSLPKLMSTVEGTVEAVHMVSRISEEGSKLFSVDIVVPNAGVLSKDMEATAVLNLKGETVYPYESGKLAYYRTTDLNSTVGGTVISSNLLDWMQVSAGQVVLRIDGESNDIEILNKEQSLENAEKALEEAEKNYASCNATAPISGQVIGLAVIPGQEITSGEKTVLVTISDTTTMVVKTTVNERSVSMIEAGMPVNIEDQSGNSAFGTVESISLSGTVSNTGTVSFPMVISVDNTEGNIRSNSYVNFTVSASKSDNCMILPIQSVRTVSLEDGSLATVVYVKSDGEPENAVVVSGEDETIPEGFYPVPVEIGIQDTTNVEILSGVEEGQEVFSQMMTTEVWG